MNTKTGSKKENAAAYFDFALPTQMIDFSFGLIKKLVYEKICLSLKNKLLKSD